MTWSVKWEMTSLQGFFYFSLRSYPLAEAVAGAESSIVVAAMAAEEMWNLMWLPRDLPQGKLSCIEEGIADQEWREE